MNSVTINQYIEGVLTASLGTSLILFGLPSLATIPKIGRGTSKKDACKALFYYVHFFLSCFLLAACITIRVLMYEMHPNFNVLYLAAAVPAGACVALFGLLFYRLLMLVYGAYVGMLVGMVIQAGLSNATPMDDVHQWGKLITLTAGICLGFLNLKASPTSWLPRIIYAVAGAGLLAMSPPCWAQLPSEMKRPVLVPWLMFIPETQVCECGSLPTNQEGYYIFWGIMGVILAIPMFLFKFIPWFNRKFHCTLINQEGCGLRIKFRPNMPDHERQGLMGAIKEYRKMRKEQNRLAKEERKRRKAAKKAEKAAKKNKKGGAQENEEVHDVEIKEKRQSVSSLVSLEGEDATISSISGQSIRERIQETMKLETSRVDQLGTRFGMWNKQREKMLRGEQEDEEEEQNNKPLGMIDWKRGTPDKVVPAVKILATRLLHFFIMGWGLFWLVWLCGWGHNWQSFIAGISWFGFALAEIVNYLLGIVYNFNFWTATIRKRKCLYALEGFLESVERVRVDTLIFHYREDPNTTQRTLQGCLLMKRTPNVDLTHRICDDSFGQKRSDSIKSKIQQERQLAEELRGGGSKRSKTIRQWLKEKSTWLMGGKRCPLFCFKLSCKKKGHRKNRDRKDNTGKDDQQKTDATDYDSESDPELEEDFSNSSSYAEDTVSQADLDRYPFPEFDPLFYPLPEALEKEIEKRKCGGSSSEAEDQAPVKAIKPMGKLGWDYEPEVASKGKQVDFEADEKAKEEEDRLYEQEKRFLSQPLTDRLRKIYEKNRRILRHLALGTDFNGTLYDFEPSQIGREVVMRVMEVMEVYLGGPVVPVLHLKEEMYRDDCARGSLSITFELRDAQGNIFQKNKKRRSYDDQTESIQVVCNENGEPVCEGLWENAEQHQLYPDMHPSVDRVKIIARIKPPEHHNKAGNINNVLYNTEVLRKGQFLIFLDNDMRPESDFLLYTLPWFYTEGEPRQWEINSNLSFVQTPQVFLDNAVANGDKLGNANKVFFSAIQPGRDGENACAFAGTNAIFSKRALLRIGGIPYESQTEDAHTSIRLHKDGFVSYYVNIPLVVGDAPTTVASRQLQFLRWVKGSIQLWWAQFYRPPRRTCIGEAPPELPKEERPSGLMLGMFAIDTMTWPLSAISALIYMFCALVFVFFGDPPVRPNSPFSITSFLWVFLPYLCLRMLNNWIALQGVKSSSIWVAQEMWYSQAFTAFLGILDALYEKFMGVGLTGWKSTGEGTRTTKIEYFNVIIAALLVFGIIMRVILFLASSSSNRLISFGSAFFAGVILIQLWPTVSMSLYELLVNRYKPSDEKKELGRFKIPNWLMFTVILVVGISAGVLLN